MNETKIAKLKKKIKDNAPAALACATLITGTIIVVAKTINQTTSEANSAKEGLTALIIPDNGDGFPEVTGDVKSEVLGAESTILNRISDNDYILTVIPTN